VDGVSRAAWVLAAGLLLWPLLPAPEPEPECARPAALASERVPTVAVRCGGGPPLRGAARLLFDQRLDANRADAASLETLPGIGPVRAAAIVAERERRPFASLEELVRVPGIGPRTLARLRSWLEIEPARVPLRRRGSG